MEEKMVQFIAALRAAGARISLAESGDAFQAAQEMGVINREAFRVCLRSTLIKDARFLDIYDELFPLYFGGAGDPKAQNLNIDLTPEEALQLAQALRQLSERVRQMLERLLQGKELTREELEKLSQFTGLNQAEDLRFREWMAQRMERALRFREVQEALEELAALLAQLGMQSGRAEEIRGQMQANLKALSEQLHRFAGQRIAENMSARPPDDPVDGLLNRPFSSLTENDMQRLRQEVRRLAAILRTRVSLRQKRAKTGQLDAKATIRANLKHNNVPIVIKHRNRVLKPKLVVICDVSTSMRPCSELMLSLLYALQDQIRKTHAFAFIDHLEFISPDLGEHDPGFAVRQVLRKLPSGYYNTDLGFALQNFSERYLDTVDQRTTFLIVGDGRNNYNDPRLDLFQLLARRSRRTIWIIPEAQQMWGTGDSDMLEYAQKCDTILQAGTLAELTQAVDRLLG